MTDITSTDRAYVPASASSNSTSFASISFPDGTNYLFYYNSDDSIACLSGKDAAIFSNTTVQPSAGITIQSGSTSPLAASCYERGNQKEIRVYYVEGSTGLIKEICSTDGRSWKSGAFNDKRHKIAPGGGLTADATNLSLKVFFADANNKGKIVQAYLNLNEGVWRSNIIQ